MKIIFKRLFGLLILITSFFSPLYALNFFDQGAPAELAAALETAMTDEQVLAQVFMLGWVGEEPSPLIMEWVRQRGIGSVKIFGWNTSDTQKLARSVGELQQASLRGAFNIPLFVATDQEGGWVRHVRGSTSETPGNMAIGASGYPRDSYLSGYYIGKEMALLGINMNFAPVIDLFTNRNSVLIGPRAFGDDPVRAGIFGAAFARGQLDNGVIPTAKHFPGHGDTALDSHGILPRIDIPYETLWERELVPYRMMIAEGIPAIMSGHLAFPLTEGGNTPASLSRFFLTEVLRNRMGFTGLIITDDLMMVGATAYLGSLSLTAKQALIAGNDILMFSSTPYLNDAIWTHLLNSMRTEPDFRRIVRASTRRILENKLRYLRGDKRVPYIPNLTRVEREIPDPEGAAFFLNLASRSVTILKPNPPTQVFPISPERSGRILLAGRFREFFNYGSRTFPSAAVFRYTNASSPEDILPFARDADTIIFCIGDEIDLPMIRILQQLDKRVVVFSVLSPVLVESVPWVTGVVAVYSYAPISFAAGFSAITGRIPAQGNLPYE